MTADKAYIDNLTARIGDFGFITADNADLKYATIKSLQVVDGKIDTLSSKAITTENLSAKVADLGYLSVKSAEVGYAKIDFSNVGTQVVDTSMIKDGAVTNEKVGNLSANKITSGTIDASKITVTNLNADNLTVGTINGKLIGNGSVDLDKLSQEVPTKEYLDSVQKELQGQIDGAIETFTKSEIPTLNNEPAILWTDNETRKKHIGDVCYVLNPASSADGYCYRFANTGAEESPSYEWVLIKDSDVTKALQDIIDINGEITGIKQFDTEISSWKTDTDAELSSIKSRTTILENDMGSKVESSVFNELKQTVDENSSSITSLSTTVSKKAESSTVETLTNTVNSVKQTADTNTSSISSMQTTISKKADSSTVAALSTKTSELEQSLNGFKTTVSETYTTKTEFNNLEIGGRNLWPNSTFDLGLNGYSTTGLNGGTAEVVSGYSGHNGIKISRSDYTGIVRCWVNPSKPPYISEYDKGDVFTLSAWVYVETELTADNNNIMVRGTAGDTPQITIPKTTVIGKWTRFTASWKATSSGTYYTCYILLGKNGSMIVSNIKLEKGNKATDWSPAPEDTEEEIESVQTIAIQTADKFSWLVKSGTSATNFELTDRTATLVANYINLNGLVTFSGLGSDAQNKINTAQSTADTAKSNAATAKAKADSLGVVHYFNGNGNSNMYVEFADITISSAYINTPISFRIVSRGFEASDVQLCFLGVNNNDPGLYYLRSNGSVPLWIQKTGTSTWRLIMKKNESWGFFLINNYHMPYNAGITVNWVGVHLSSVPDGSISSDKLQEGRDAAEANNTIADWCYNNDKTYINGGKIYTGTIMAKQIDVDDLFAQTVTATNLTVSGNSKLAGWSVSGNKIVSNEFSDKSHSGGIEKATMSIDSDKGIATNCTANGNNVDCLFNGARWIASLSEYEGFEILLDGESVSCRRNTVVSGVPVPIEMVTISSNGLDVVNGTLKTQSINDTSINSSGKASTSYYGVTKLSSSLTSTSTSLAATSSAVKNLNDKRAYKCLYISSPTSATSISSIVQGDYKEMVVEVEAYVNSRYIAYSIPIPIDAVSSLTSYKDWIVGYSTGSTYWGYAEIYVKKDSIYLSSLYISSTNYKSSAVMRVYYR